MSTTKLSQIPSTSEVKAAITSGLEFAMRACVSKLSNDRWAIATNDVREFKSYSTSRDKPSHCAFVPSQRIIVTEGIAAFGSAKFRVVMLDGEPYAVYVKSLHGQRGGYRKGAGRKPFDPDARRVSKTYSATPEEHEALAETLERYREQKQDTRLIERLQ